MLVDQTDQGTDWRARKAFAGCALLAQSHSEITNFVPDMDVSLPLDGSRLPPSELRALSELQTVPSHNRRWWLTFRGTAGYKGEEGYGRHSLVSLNAHSTPLTPIAVAVTCLTVHGQHLQPPNRAWCDTLAKAAADFPPYPDLLNTTFALVPGGRQPASFRLNEVMRAGCIPIFVSGDAKTTSPYVRPFAEVIPWQQISLHASYDHLSSGALLAALHRIPAAKLQHMQHGVLHAWTHHLAPAASARTFYQLLRGRAEFRDRR